MKADAHPARRARGGGIDPLPGQRFGDQDFRTFDAEGDRSRRAFVRPDIAVDVPAIGWVGVVFEGRHDRVGVAELDRVGDPLGNLGRRGRAPAAAVEGEQQRVEILEIRLPLNVIDVRGVVARICRARCRQRTIQVEPLATGDFAADDPGKRRTAEEGQGVEGRLLEPP